MNVFLVFVGINNSSLVFKAAFSTAEKATVYVKKYIKRYNPELEPHGPNEWIDEGDCIIIEEYKLDEEDI